MTTHEEVIIIGGGGFGREAFQYLLDIGETRVAGFLDNRPEDDLNLPGGLGVLGSISTYEPRAGQAFVLAVGDPTVRFKIAARFLQAGAEFLTVVHPRAYVASSAEIGPGSLVAPFASIGASARLGPFCQVHFYASAAHDTVIGAYSALSPYSVVNGGGRLGECTFLGTRSTVNPGRAVGERSKVAAGAVVYQDIPAFSLAAGNPAKPRRLMTTGAPG